MPEKESKVSVSLEENQEIIDILNGVSLKWKYNVKKKNVNITSDKMNQSSSRENKFFELTFNKKHRDMVLDSYINHIMEKSKEISRNNEKKKKKVKLFTLNQERLLTLGLGRAGNIWRSINLDHPSTFDTLAMETDLKKMIMEDPLFIEIEELIEETEVTPAEVGEQLKKSEEPEIALRGLIDFLEKKKRENYERKKKESEKSTTNNLAVLKALNNKEQQELNAPKAKTLSLSLMGVAS
ncbi:hypothetical protein JCGZ_26786 [Jatropha curcas]|uniref:AAA+ ATPase At3g28540-like C-terminal domain-containing protein n=1 Tax=Jatropha curcas TaxID=180498 RepID=A0A067L3J4_JATCU|nr:hypothetical protein JCGZ_26786 [Jatropha curcas]